MDNSLTLLNEQMELMLRRVEASLEAHLENPDKAAPWQSLADDIDQIRGALVLLEQTEAASLSAEIAVLARKLAGGEYQGSRSGERELTGKVLLRAVLQLSGYLETLNYGKKPATNNILSLTRRLHGLNQATDSRERCADFAENDTAGLLSGTWENTIGPSPEMLEQLARPLREILASARDAIEDFINEGGHSQYRLQHEVNNLHVLANVLTMLNMEACAELIRQQRKVLREWLENGDKISRESPIQLATKLILVDNFLEVIGEYSYIRVSANSLGENLNGSTEMDLLLRLKQWKTQQTVVLHILQVIGQGRKLITDFRDSGGQTVIWEQFHALLRQVRGTLTLLGNEKVATLAQRLETMAQRFMTTGKPPENLAAFLDTLAETVVSLEHYLELSASRNGPDETLLRYAQHRLAGLEAMVVAPSSPLTEGASPPAQDTEMIAPAETMGGLMAIAAEIKTGDSGDIFSPEQRALDITVLHALPTSAARTFDTTDNSHIDPDPVGTNSADTLSQETTPASSGVDPEILEIFFEEAREELDNICKNLAAWHSGSTDREVLKSIRRSFHTLKGSGRMVEQFTIGEFAWNFEQLFNRLLDGTLPASTRIMDTVDAAQAVLSALVGSVPDDGTGMARLQHLTARAEALLRGGETAAELPEPAPVGLAGTEQAVEEQTATPATVAERDESLSRTSVKEAARPSSGSRFIHRCGRFVLRWLSWMRKK